MSRWIDRSAQTALEEAYQGALTIRAIEEQHFGGNLIMAQPDHGKTVTDYFRTQLDRQLLRVRSSLFKFRLLSLFVSSQAFAAGNLAELPANPSSPQLRNSSPLEIDILDKLAFIESVVGSYRQFNDLAGLFSDSLPQNREQSQETRSLQAQPDDPTAHDEVTTTTEVGLVPDPGVITRFGQAKPMKTVVSQTKSVKSKPPEVMRLFGGAGKIGKELNPDYEQEVIKELRVRRSQNRMAVRWLLILLLVPLLVQTVTKHLVLGPVFGSYFDRNPIRVELSQEVEEEFLQEFTAYREELEIKRLLAKSAIQEEQQRQQPAESSDSPAEEVLAKAIFGRTSDAMQDMLSMQPGRFSSLISRPGWTEVQAELEEEALQEKAVELWREARQKQLNGLRNVIADSAALVVFLGLLFFGGEKTMAIQGFANRAFLGLNDPSKVFLFILITDMFVGFHSAEGWDVILESLAQHFGLPENQAAIKGFIATVPVIIDSCIKFWIFSYLTRYSPSTSAIYERMNT